MESRQCGFFGVSSGKWIVTKICHTRCKERAVLQNVSGGVTLRLKNKETTSDIVCSQKASLLNEYGCESLVDWTYERSCHTLGIGGPWSSAGWKQLVIIRITKLTPTNNKELVWTK